MKVRWRLSRAHFDTLAYLRITPRNFSFVHVRGSRRLLRASLLRRLSTLEDHPHEHLQDVPVGREAGKFIVECPPRSEGSV